MRTQLSELRGELEREKNERMILEKEVMKVMDTYCNAQWTKNPFHTEIHDLVLFSQYWLQKNII